MMFQSGTRNNVSPKRRQSYFGLWACRNRSSNSYSISTRKTLKQKTKRSEHYVIMYALWQLHDIDPTQIYTKTYVDSQSNYTHK